MCSKVLEQLNELAGLRRNPLRSLLSISYEYSSKQILFLFKILSDFRQRRLLSPGSTPRVTENEQTLTLLFKRAIHSQMSLSNPSTLLLSYTRTMTGFLLFQPTPQRVVMIGLGGGSLVRWCHEFLVKAHLKVIEISQEVIDLRLMFLVPPDDQRLKISLGDGAQYVQQTFDRPDVLLVDGYDPDDRPSRQTCTQTFYDNCYRTLDDEGVLVVNLPDDLGKCIRRIRRSFANRVTIVTPADGYNKIVFAIKGAIRQPEIDSLEALSKRFKSEFARVYVDIDR